MLVSILLGAIGTFGTGYVAYTNGRSTVNASKETAQSVYVTEMKQIIENYRNERIELRKEKEELEKIIDQVRAFNKELKEELDQLKKENRELLEVNKSLTQKNGGK